MSNDNDKVLMLPHSSDREWTDTDIVGRALTQVKTGRLSSVIVIGYDENEELYVAASDEVDTMADVNWMLDHAKQEVLDYGRE